MNSRTRNRHKAIGKCIKVLLPVVFMIAVCTTHRHSLAQMGSPGISLKVDAGKGLNLRKEASRTSPSIALIPGGSTVNMNHVEPVAETVSGTTGYWVNVQWEGKSGFAFSAFLKRQGGPLTFDDSETITGAFQYAEGETGRYHLQKDRVKVRFKAGTLTLTEVLPPMDEITTVLSESSREIEFEEGYPTVVTFRINKISYKFEGGLNKYSILGKLISVKVGN
jgi:hypothetical protein